MEIMTNMFDEARSLKCMLELRKMTQKELATSLGVSTSYVANKLRLLQHTEDMQKRITDCRVSERHARALLRLNDLKERETALRRIVDERMSVERAEAMICIMSEDSSHEKIASGNKCRGVTRLLDNVKASCNALASLGVHVKHSIRYIDKKLCIYITVDEE